MARNAPPKGGGALHDIPKIRLRRRLICLVPGPKWNPCFIFRTMSVASVAQFKTLTCLTTFCSSGWGISSPEAMFLPVNTKNGDLWKGPKPEVRDSWTFHYSAHAQSQVEKIWLAESMKRIICTCSQNQTWSEVAIFGADQKQHYVPLGMRMEATVLWAFLEYVCNNLQHNSNHNKIKFVDLFLQMADSSFSFSFHGAGYSQKVVQSG